MRTTEGQALVESALTLPLVIFMILGTIQLFMLMQGRAMAQYAVARSTRAGSLKHGDCKAMVHAAVAALLPNFTRASTPVELAAQWKAREKGYYVPALDHGQYESIAWVIREGPRVRRDEEELFDRLQDPPPTLLVRMVHWYPLQIPFADWVISRMMLSYFGLRNLDAVNPLMPTQSNADWHEGGNLSAKLATELVKRANVHHYVVPIQVTWSMKMMTPARAANLLPKECAPYP